MMTGTSFVDGERLFWREWTIYGMRVNAVRMMVLALDCIVEQGLVLVLVFSTMGNCSSAHFTVFSYSRVCLCFY